MSAFFIPDTNLTADHHRKCAEKCTQQSGPMLKCMNVKAVGDLPCQHLVHVKCLVGLDAFLVSHISKYYCIECTTNFPHIAKEMEGIIDAARQDLERQNASLESNSDIASMSLQITSLQKQLESMQNLLREQLSETEFLEKRLVDAEADNRRLKGLIHTSSSDKASRKSLSETNLMYTTAVGSQVPSHSKSSLNITTELEDQVRQRRSKRPLNSTSFPGNVTFNISRSESSIHDTSYFSSSVCPDYATQEEKASLTPETTLALMRSSIAKPQPFSGDITKWTIFRTDFVRTSSRGHYRAIEDMDRLRELIQGEARELFLPELTDPYADPLNILQHFDDFYGVRGNAVRVSLDRVTALSKMDKISDKDQLKALYIHAKQFAAQCRSNDQESELTSQAVLYLFESKLHPDLIKLWRIWLRDTHGVENVDSLIKFLEDRIKELNFAPVKSKAVSSIHFTDATGGLDAATVSVSQDDKKQTKREKRLAKIKCFKCTNECHPFWKCPVLIKAASSMRAQIVNELHVCVRCLSSTKHIASNCPNKLHPCRVPECLVQNKHPLLHGHPDDKIKRFVSLNFCRISDVRFEKPTSHFAIIPGDVISSDGRHIPITIMLDNGSQVSFASLTLFREASYVSKAQQFLEVCHASGQHHPEPNATYFDLLFMPHSMDTVITITDIIAIDNLELPAQCQDADVIKSIYPYLKDVPVPSYRMQSPRVLLGLSHAGYLMQTKHVFSSTADAPIAALTPLGWTVYGRCDSYLGFQQ